MPLKDNPRRYREFARRLRLARKNAHLTQQDVARRLNKSQSWVSKCETGERRVDILELAEFAHIYGISDLAWFLPTDEE